MSCKCQITKFETIWTTQLVRHLSGCGHLQCTTGHIHKTYSIQIFWRFYFIQILIGRLICNFNVMASLAEIQNKQYVFHMLHKEHIFYHSQHGTNPCFTEVLASQVCTLVLCVVLCSHGENSNAECLVCCVQSAIFCASLPHWLSGCSTPASDPSTTCWPQARTRGHCSSIPIRNPDRAL